MATPSLIPPTWLRAAALLLVLLAPMAAHRARAANTVEDNFTGDNATNPWVALGGACLTAGDSNTTISSTGIGIPACIGDSYYTSSRLPFVGLPQSGTAADAVGSGALRLTNGGTQGTNESGAIISTTPFSATQGIQVTFTTYTYGGNQYQSNGQSPGADGIGFYLIDASKYGSGSAFLSSNGYFAQGDLGAFGGSLGYSCSNTNPPYNGMIGGYVGLGIDEYGNFLNYGDNTASGQTVNPGNEGNQNPGEIGLRGAGSVNWAWLNATYPAYYPSSVPTTTDPSSCNGRSCTYREHAVYDTCRTGQLWDYSNPSSPSKVSLAPVKTSTAYTCTTKTQTKTSGGTTYADLNSSYPYKYPYQRSNNGHTYTLTAADQATGLADTCQSGMLYKFTAKYSSESWSTGWQETSSPYTCTLPTTTTTTSTTTTYADLQAANSTYYPGTLTSTQQAAAVTNTCNAGYLYDYSQNGSIPDYAVMAAVTLPGTQPISSQESGSGSNVSATRTKATPITYKLIITSDGKLSFYYDYNNAVDTATQQLKFTQVLDQVPISASNGTPPSSYLFGFGGSTGGGTNVHEISCFEATPAARTIGSPVAPLTVSSGSLLYTLNSNPSPVAGYVYAYTLDASGTPSTSYTWEASTKMSDQTRSQDLYSTALDGSSVVSLSKLDSAAFALSTPTTCVPDTGTIVNYTVDPNSSYSPTPSGCSAPYLGSRQVNSLLDQFSPGDDAALLMPPHDPTLLSLPGYNAYAVKESKRAAALLFTNDDGFLYSIDASKGTLNWGWMPRSFASQLQNYTSWPYQDNFAGRFTVADASQTTTSTSGTQTPVWGTYVVGSAQGGALWYDLELDSTGAPSTVVKTFGPPQTTMPGNTTALPSGTLSYPQRQAPTVASIGGSQYAAFVVNATTGSGTSATTTSTLYEFNVATGASTSAAIPTTTTGIGSGNYVTSNVFYDPNSATLLFGTSAGKVYSMSFTGAAATDIGNIADLGSTEDLTAVQFVGYQELGSQPYLWAASTNTITVFGINNTGWSPLWASAPGKSYTYGSGGTWSAVTAASSPSSSSSSPSTSSSSPSTSTTPTNVPTSLQADATITDLPVVVDGVLVVPAYVAPNSTQACNVLGKGYYDFFSIATGAFPDTTLNPIKQKVVQNGKLVDQPVTQDLYLGEGKPYSPSISLSELCCRCMAAPRTRRRRAIRCCSTE